MEGSAFPGNDNGSVVKTSAKQLSADIEATAAKIGSSSDAPAATGVSAAIGKASTSTFNSTKTKISQVLGSGLRRSSIYKSCQLSRDARGNAQHC